MVMQPKAPLEPVYLVPCITVGVVGGAIAFLINPVIGILAFFFGGESQILSRLCNLSISLHTESHVRSCANAEIHDSIIIIQLLSPCYT